MSFHLAVGGGRHCTLYSRVEYRSCCPVGAPGETAGKTLIESAVAGDLARDTAQLARLCDFLRNCHVAHDAQRTEPLPLLRALQHAVSGGDVIAVVEPLRSSGVPSRIADDGPRPRSITFTPSQIFRRAVARPVVGRQLPSSGWKRLRAQDGIAIWFANPGDVLPDGTIAKPLGSAQAFEYSRDEPTGDAMALAGIDRGDLYACDVISAECKGSVLREFPSQYLGTTLNDIQSDARNGVKDARKALKLLNDNRFKK